MDGWPLLALALVAVAVWLAFRLRAAAAASDRSEIEMLSVARELRLTRESLETARVGLVRLSDAVFDAVLLIDPERRVIGMNSAAREAFGVGEEALDQTVMAITRQHELDAMVEGVLRGEERPEIQLSLDGKTYRVRAVAQSLPERTLAVVVLQDISELMRLTRARRDMVANLSHDLRTPISNIRLLVETLVLNFGKNAERDLKMLGRIASATESLHHMTQELIDLSMIESGKAIIRMVDIPLDQIIHSALDVLESQIEEKKIALVNSVPPDLRVLADPDQLRRVVANLAQNAVKFTQSGGEIQISAEVIDKMVTVSICDNGPGIPPQDRTRVFERFYQVDSPRTGSPRHNGRGTGLGLAIAKHIVEAHGGKIWAEGNIPTGTNILFSVPLSEAHAAPYPTGAGPDQPAGSISES